MGLAGTFTCPDCGGRAPERGVETVTGRRVCQDCHDVLLGAGAGIVASGSTDPGSTVPQAIATAGWFRLLRRRRH